jgi:hypothetical protein
MSLMLVTPIVVGPDAVAVAPMALVPTDSRASIVIFVVITEAVVSSRVWVVSASSVELSRSCQLIVIIGFTSLSARTTSLSVHSCISSSWRTL